MTVVKMVSGSDEDGDGKWQKGKPTDGNKQRLLNGEDRDNK